MHPGFILESLFYIIGISFLRVAGNEFSNEACKEELHSNEQRHKGKVEERLVCDCPEFQALGLCHHFVYYKPYGYYRSNKECEYSHKPKEVHRFLAKA